MLRDEVFEEDLYDVAEDDRIGDLHHRRLEMDGEEDALSFRLRDLCFEERNERLSAQHGSVDDLTGFERGLLLEHLGGAIDGDELDPHLGGF